jgi:hypothetical protein
MIVKEEVVEVEVVEEEEEGNPDMTHRIPYPIWEVVRIGRVKAIMCGCQVR